MFKKQNLKYLSIGLVSIILTALISGCGNTNSSSVTSSEAVVSSQSTSQPVAPPLDKTEIRVATLKGPTGMGMVGLMQSNEEGTSANSYKFALSGAPEDVRAMVISGEADIAAVPTNMAAALYNKDPASIKILAVNTLGVLYIMQQDQQIATMADLKGKTIYATGQGSAPEYVLNYLLEKNGIDPQKDIEIVYKSEHTELSTLMVADEVKLGMLPEPFVTTTQLNNDKIKVAIDLTEEWNKVSNGADLAMGAIIVSTKFLEQNPEAVEIFMEEYEQSVAYVNRDISEAAEAMEKFDIIKKSVAEKSIPNCNIVFLTGEDMNKSVSGFLNVLFEANPKSVGGSLPDESFYYTK